LSSKEINQELRERGEETMKSAAQEFHEEGIQQVRQDVGQEACK
jgi:hypothetical protein